MKVYTVTYRRKDGEIGWTSVWATNARDAVDAVAERNDVAVVTKAVPNG